jgi:methyl-accepting chemotaxis protein
MAKIIFRIATPIIIAGFFVMMVFIALNYQNLSASFLIVFSLLAVYVFLFGFATGQELSSPIKQILNQANKLSEGDVTSKTYLEGKDELSEISRAFNKIADKLEESRIALEHTEKSVDIKVKARTQALEETINALEQKVKNRTIELERMIEESGKLRQARQAPIAQQPPKIQEPPVNLPSEPKAPADKI